MVLGQKVITWFKSINDLSRIKISRYVFNQSIGFRSFQCFRIWRPIRFVTSLNMLKTHHAFHHIRYSDLSQKEEFVELVDFVVENSLIIRGYVHTDLRGSRTPHPYNLGFHQEIKFRTVICQKKEGFLESPLLMKVVIV